jgi:hypothetical protein
VLSGIDGKRRQRQRPHMPHYLLIGAGFSRNWGGPLSDEITGSLLGDMHDDPGLCCGVVPSRTPFRDFSR